MSRRLRTHQLEEPAKDTNALPQLLDANLFVRCVQPIIGEPYARQHDRSPLPRQRRYDGNRATNTDRDRCTPFDFPKRLCETLERRRCHIGKYRLRPVNKINGDGSVVGRQRFDRTS